jgi:hypothetical protein
MAAANTAAQPAIESAAPPHWHDIKTDWMDTFHHPTDGLELGLDLRLREVYARNIFSPDDQFGDSATAPYKAGNWNNQQWQRFRTRLSAVWTMAPDVTLNTRLVWEFWNISSPDNHFTDASSTSCGMGARDTDLREMIFDRLNIQWKNAFDLPMTLTVGRQDIILGTGWLVLEGTPQDGERTIFFDAVRATIDLRDTTQLDLIYIKQYDNEDKWLNPFNHREQLHLTQGTDEDGMIFYLTDKSIENTQLEAYYIYKKEEPSRWSDFYPGSAGVNSEIHTLGGRVAQNLGENWSYSAEVAKQFGSRNEESMKGLGSNNKLAYAFNDELKNELRLTYEYLSGDKPGTKGSEKFDTLWGDWPQSQRGSDLQSYMWTFEGALGEVANLHRLGFGHTFKPHKEWTVATDYNLMWADQNGTASGPAAVDAPHYSANSYFRGQLISCVATYSCCRNFKTNFAVDYFIPGNYYAQSNRDNAVFARVNVEWTF